MSERVNMHQKLFAELTAVPLKEIGSSGKQITILIETDNEAFTDDPWEECRRILHELAAKDLAPGDSINLRDVNGNKVGSMRWSCDKYESN